MGTNANIVGWKSLPDVWDTWMSDLLSRLSLVTIHICRQFSHSLISSNPPKLLRTELVPTALYRSISQVVEQSATVLALRESLEHWSHKVWCAGVPLVPSYDGGLVHGSNSAPAPRLKRGRPLVRLRLKTAGWTRRSQAINDITNTHTRGKMDTELVEM